MQALIRNNHNSNNSDQDLLCRRVVRTVHWVQLVQTILTPSMATVGWGVWVNPNAKSEDTVIERFGNLHLHHVATASLNTHLYCVVKPRATLREMSSVETQALIF